MSSHSNSNRSSVSEENQEYVYNNTPTDSINSDDLMRSEDTNTVIILDSDEEIYTDDEHDEYIIDDIYRDECEYLDTEKQSGHYYIGVVGSISQDAILYANSIRPQTFFKYAYAHSLSYLQLYSIFRIRKPKIEIIKLLILDDSTHIAILKTHWLRIVQRTWKKIHSQRKIILNKRMSPNARRLFEISGRYPPDACYMPSIRGTLYAYNKPTINGGDSGFLFSECH
jgi:hypothetical protein